MTAWLSWMTWCSIPCLAEQRGGGMTCLQKKVSNSLTVIAVFTGIPVVIKLFSNVVEAFNGVALFTSSCRALPD